MPSANEIKEELGFDSVSKRDGIFTARVGFFYTHGRSEDDLVSAIRYAYPDAKIIDSGEIWKPFRGGATVAKSSHWFVKFKLPE